MSTVRKSARMVWSKARIKVLADLVAAHPAMRPGDLAAKFNAVTRGSRVTARMVAFACSYHGIQRVCRGDRLEPQPWSNQEVAAVRSLFYKVSLRSVSLDEVTQRLREITGREVFLSDLPEMLVQRVRNLRVFLLLRGIRAPSPGDVPIQAHRELAARRAMVSWLDREQLVKAVGPIVKEAVTWCSRPPGQEDPAELEVYDPEVPENWWDPETFLDNVLRGLEEELRRQFEEAGMPERQDEMFRKVRARYEAEYRSDAPQASGSLFDILGDSISSASETGAHAIKPAGSHQDLPVISANS
jgi:hypothetical protein